MSLECANMCRLLFSGALNRATANFTNAKTVAMSLAKTRNLHKINFNGV